MSIHEFAGYSIVRNIIGGGMANLYVALDHQQQRVVIRALKHEYVRNRKVHKAFLQNAEILSTFQHPNIIQLIDSGKDGKLPYMVLEYLDARNMRELILHRDPLLCQNQLSLIRQMATALYYLHCQNYIHLDFKPENLLVQPDGQVILIDFDLVMPRKNKPTKIKQVPGTPAYVAPEVLTKRLVDERADIFSFGVTCYEMLSFHKPFEMATVDGSLAAQIDPSVLPSPMSRHNVSVPPRLETIVLKCLAKDPDHRYPSMSLVVKDLESLV